MASQSRSPGWDGLPDEIRLQILNYLDPYHVARLQLVSRRLQKLCLDDELWKRFCFESSPWYQALKNRRQRGDDRPDDTIRFGADADVGSPPAVEEMPPSLSNVGKARRRRMIRDMANWDPVFPGERISWYNEYAQREGPASVSWFPMPRIRDRGLEAIIEARGLALYSPNNGHDGTGTTLAVSPLDSGAICLWDVGGSRGRQGSILAQSRPDILFIDGPGRQNAQRSKRIDTGVTECVSVDNHRHRAFFAVQSHLIEVDLNRLDVVSRESFEWSITTLSSVHAGVPLTVGTTLGIHLHDFRARATVASEAGERLDDYGQCKGFDVFKSIFDSKPLPPYASLSQPTPTSILHLPLPGSHVDVSDDIYVSGRFSNILHYDRRKFPAIVGSIYSGALINTMAALPYPFSTVDNEVRRRGEFTAEQVARAKAAQGGRTLIAGGHYKTKGSLEIYGLSSTSNFTGRATVQNSLMKNRQTAASGSILSITNHGTKIAFADGAGLIKWFERDGSTECRRLRIGHSDSQPPESLFASMGDSDDLARKILSTQPDGDQERPNNDNLLFWTGERLGMVSFTSKPLFLSRDFESEKSEAAEEGDWEEAASVAYGQQMREALEWQADEVKFVKRLGVGTRP